MFAVTNHSKKCAFSLTSLTANNYSLVLTSEVKLAFLVPSSWVSLTQRSMDAQLHSEQLLPEGEIKKICYQLYQTNVLKAAVSPG